MRMPPRRVVVVSLAVAGTLPGDSLLYAVLPIVWGELGLELWMVGALLSVNRFVRLLTNPIAGWLVERTGMRRPFLVAVFASVGTTAAYALGSGFAVLLVARALWGVCWSFLRLGGYLAALDAADERSRGYFLGFYSGVARIGTLLAVLCGGVLTDWMGFRSTALAFAGVTLLAGLALLREQAPAGSDVRELQALEARRRPARTPAAGESTRERSRRWAVYAAAFISSAAAMSLLVSTIGLWLVERFGKELEIGSVTLGVATVSGILLAVRFSTDVLWSPLSGHFSDSFGRRRLLGAAGLMTALGLLLLPVASTLLWTVALSMLVFLGSTALRVTLDASAGDVAPIHARSRVMSWYASWSDLGAAVGPFIAYPLAEQVGLAWVYRGGAVCLVLLGALVLLLLPRGARAWRGSY